MSDKTEQPTAKRLRKAREQGDSPRSPALAQGTGFVVALSLAPAALAALALETGAMLRSAIEHPEQPLSAFEVGLSVISLTAPLVLATAFASAAITRVQTGGALSFKRLSPSLDRLDPVNGARQLFAPERLFAVVRALAAALFVGYFTYRTLLGFAPDIAFGVGETASATVLAEVLGKRLGWAAALFGLALGGLDFLFTYRAFLRRNRMTKEEVKREHKESEGDPEVKAARRRAHREALYGSALNAVKKATVLIVNPTHIAVALEYDEERDQAPKILAQGHGDLAKMMIEAARAYGVPCVRDVPVARALAELEVGDEIPEALYEAVAEILREVWQSEPEP
jgi:type III secretion protein U